MNIKEKLLNVQVALKAPKGQRNDFGKFNYRSCEDILEAVKPLLRSNSVTLSIKDDIMQVGERYYIKATAVFQDTENDEVITNTAFAREEDAKKGMDGSQITGTASSYARKYALNGLFLIDDTKDADTNAHTEQRRKAEKSSEEQRDKDMANEVKDKMIDDAKASALRAKLKVKGLAEETICKSYGVMFIEALNVDQFTNAMRRLDHTPDADQVNLGL